MDYAASPGRSAGALVACQTGLVAAGIAAAALAPPADGRLWLIPITPGAAAALPILALDQQALLLGDGPLPGSRLMMGHGAAMSWPMLRAGILVLAGPPAGCGVPRGGADGRAA